MSETEFLQLCYRVDKCLRQINIVRTSVTGLLITSGIGFLLALLSFATSWIAAIPLAYCYFLVPGIVLLVASIIVESFVLPSTAKKAFENIKSSCDEQSSKNHTNEFSESINFKMKFHLCDGISTTPEKFHPKEHSFPSSFIKTYHHIYICINVSSESIFYNIEESSSVKSQRTVESILLSSSSSSSADDSAIATIMEDDELHEISLVGNVDNQTVTTTTEEDTNNKRSSGRRKQMKKKKKVNRQHNYSREQPSELEMELREFVITNNDEDKKDKRKKSKNKTKKTKKDRRTSRTKEKRNDLSLEIV